ncbi:conjugal transfer protein [Streptomyces sp. NBC_00063]|uniref:conjugal transfer protein n=1 Tax=Streptomyces sp. NBC_00063 TaxID=2975638 RepID=UPI00224DD05F|nr:conjugal transfer protein [Streptomyces sp. NBC_00063]MCX5441238.1 conjugal transfer protein [Streptomyces sp. NBC_00063]
MPAPALEAPPTAAGLDLERTRRTIRLGRAGVWACLLAGPAALTLALTQPAVTVVPPNAPAPSPTAAAAVTAADPSGYVAEFADAWLRSDADAPGSASAMRALHLGPGVSLPKPADGAKAPQKVTAVRSVQRSGSRWSVTVAAQYADGIRYLAVPVTASKSGDAVAVTGTPALVAAPAAAKATPSVYRVEVPDGPLVDTVGDFLTAYLGGSGDVDRYLAPRTSLDAVAPALADQVGVEVVTAREEEAAGEQVASDGTRVHVEASVSAHTESGTWPLSYELTLAARGGRWEIAALTSGGGAAK